ncbi:MAG: DUF2889 domain-containing protein [Betaproteobacteria bacterium]|nr:DUF2889 domain-containing protein [Betaproteobacteria bacterium]
MTLAAPAPRRHLHTRSIHCEGFERNDGLYDIEARIIDTKAYVYTETMRGERKIGDLVHDMHVRLTMDADMMIRAVEVSMPSTPYDLCQSAAPAFQGLIGKQIGAGWRRAVNEAAGGTKGCTHVRELMQPLATVAFQTIHGWRRATDQRANTLPDPNDKSRPGFINGCLAWAEDGEVVRKSYPEYHRPAKVAVKGES